MGKTSGKRTNLYIVCAVLFPLPFVGFVLGFSLPVWQGNSDVNTGLWQVCEAVVKNCAGYNFNDGGDWMVGVRAVEIFALVMFVAAALDICYENCCTNFKARPFSERIGAGITCILGGLGGLAGVIVYVVKTEDSTLDYGWAFALVAASSSLVILLGIGFCISGFFLEPRKNERQQTTQKEQLNGRTPYLTSNDENYELSAYASRNNAYHDPSTGGRPPTSDNLPGFAVYNGMMNYPGQRNSLPPLGMTSSSAYPAPGLLNGRGGVGGGGALVAYTSPTQPKHAQYYSLSDDRLLDPNFDLSEGFSYVSSRSRRVGQDNPAYYPKSEVAVYSRAGGTRPEEAYLRGGGGGGGGSRVVEEPQYSRSVVGREEDPYSRIHRGPPRAGYNDPYGFDRLPGTGGGGGGMGGARGGGGSMVEGPYSRSRLNGAEPMRDSYYRGRF